MIQEIKEFLFINNKLISKRSRLDYFVKHGKMDLYTRIDSAYDACYSLREKVMMLLSNIQQKTCKMCAQPAAIHILGGTAKLSVYCGNSCKNKDMQFIMKDIIPLRDEVSAQKKREATLLAKTGFRFNSQRPELKHHWTKSKLPSDVLLLLTDKTWIIDQYKTQKKSAQEIALAIGTHYGTVLAAIDDHGLDRNEDYQRSFAEVLLVNNLKTYYQGKILLNDKSILKPKHIDIYCPERKLGIEIDGLYWHSAGDKDSAKFMKLKHINKTDAASKKDVLLIHFTDQEVMKKLPLVVSMIKSRLAISDTKLHARKCTLKEVTIKEAKCFFNENHMSGYANAKINLALLYDDKIVQMVSFNKPRFSKEADWELIRFATKLNTNIVGGFQKLLMNFRANFSGSILSYCDRRFGTGGVYELAGFKLVRTTPPGYFWTKGNMVISRYMTQKSKLKLFLGPDYTEGTEDESMFAANYKKFWDCGHNVFLLDNLYSSK